MIKKCCYSNDQVAGVLLGTFIGNAIGAFYDGRSNDAIPPLDLQMVLRLKPKVYTNDMQMNISVFEEMLENGTIDPESLKTRFLKRYSIWRGYNGGVREVFERWKDGENFSVAAQSIYNGSGSFGDGAAMRSAPVSCFFRLDESEPLIDLVTLSSKLTHANQLGIDGAIIQAYAVLMALNNIPVSEWISRFFQLPVDNAFKIKIGLIDQCLRKSAGPHEVIQKIGNGSDALSAVPAAIFSVIKSDASFVDSVLYAIELGGDTDTIGAMAGALAGAKKGLAGIPEELLVELENDTDGRDYIISLADKAC